MPEYRSLNLATVLRSLSRATVMMHVDDEGAPALWSPGDGPLTLVHAGDTEGPVQTVFETTRSNLLVPELTGQLPWESYVTGESPTISANVWMADPDTRALWTPTGVTHGGWRRRVRDPGRTMVIIPEDLLLEGQETLGLDYVAGTFLRQPLDAAGDPDGEPEAIPAALEHLVGSIVWLWRVSPDRAPITMQSDDGSRSLETVGIIAFHHPGMPNGHHVWTMGNPDDYDIDIENADS